MSSSRKKIDRKHFISLSIILLIIYAGIAYLALTNRPGEEFFEIGLLGKDMKATDYFPEENATITTGMNITWYIMVASYFRTPQVVKIVVKIGNDKTSLPDEKTGAASNGTEIFSWYTLLNYKDVKFFMFTWKIVEIEVINGFYYLTLDLNATMMKRIKEIGAYQGKNFLIIIELWSLDHKSKDFILGWDMDNQRRIAWAHISFNITLAKYESKIHRSF